MMLHLIQVEIVWLEKCLARVLVLMKSLIILKIEIKEDKSPVSNGDLRVNELITKKIKDITPNLPIVSEETVNLKVKNTAKIFRYTHAS